MTTLIKINNTYYPVKKIAMIELTRGETIYTFANTAPQLELNPVDEIQTVQSIRKLDVLCKEDNFVMINDTTLVNPAYITKITAKEHEDDDGNPYTQILFMLLNDKVGTSITTPASTLNDIDNILDILFHDTIMKVIH